MSKNLDKEIFRQSVYDIVRLIPPGRATSYGAIAKAIGFPNLSRMVGKVMSQCGLAADDVPAHRVVNSQGGLAAGFCQMQELLESEGVVVVNNRIQNWKKIFWNPLKEIL